MASDVTDHAQNAPRKLPRNDTIKSVDEQKQDREAQNNQVIEAMTTVFSTGSTIGAFFAGFTLNIIVSADAANQKTVRLYAAICALFFVLLVLLCSAGGVVFAYYKEEFKIIMVELHKDKDKTASTTDAAKEEKSKKGRFSARVKERWRTRYLWAVFGLLPTFLFSILAAGVYFFFLIMKAYEPAVALAGLAIVGLGTLCGGIGWIALLYSYTPWGDRRKQYETEDKKAVIVEPGV